MATLSMLTFYFNCLLLFILNATTPYFVITLSKSNFCKHIFLLHDIFFVKITINKTVQTYPILYISLTIFIEFL
jgi:hypothetical protein